MSEEMLPKESRVRVEEEKGLRAGVVGRVGMKHQEVK